MPRKQRFSFPALPGRKRPYVIAHRGNQVACPENTMAAFRRALADGADILETDIHLTRDDVFVCIHDPTVDRTTNGSGAVAEMTLAELRRLSAAAGKRGFSEERIPTLAEVTALLPEDRGLALELKTDRWLGEETARRLVSLLEAQGVRGRTILLSFSLERLQAVSAVAPDLPTGWITRFRFWPPRATPLLGPYWPVLFLNPLFVLVAHRRGQAVCPLDTDPLPRTRYYLALGCDALLTDDPARLCARLGRREPRTLRTNDDRGGA